MVTMLDNEGLHSTVDLYAVLIYAFIYHVNACIFNASLAAPMNFSIGVRPASQRATKIADRMKTEAVDKYTTSF